MPNNARLITLAWSQGGRLRRKHLGLLRALRRATINVAPLQQRHLAVLYLSQVGSLDDWQV